MEDWFDICQEDRMMGISGFETDDFEPIDFDPCDDDDFDSEDDE